MPSLEAPDFILLGSMLPLLLLSGFFSASETVLYGLDADDRSALRRGGGIAAHAVESLLRQPRLLLVTILLCNMTVNTVYMTLSSLLVLRHGEQPLAGFLFGAGSLAFLIVIGEVVPKLGGQAHRVGAARFLAPPIRILHNVLLPLDMFVARFVVEPLARVLGPAPRSHLDGDELDALVDLSVKQGAIDRAEETLLREVLSLRTRRVRDIMTPRVSIVSVTVSDEPGEIRRTIEESGLRRLPVHEGELDRLIGILPCRRFLLDPPEAADPARIQAACRPPLFVPEMASVEQLLDRFRTDGATIAIVVDEFGGTSGLVTIEDVAEEIVGEIAGEEEVGELTPERLAEARWRVGGRMPLHAWRDAFGSVIEDRRISTVGGLFLARLGRLARAGDEVRLGNVRIVAERVESGLVESAIVDLVEDQR
ncbi:MAG: HlyC/CorC family transporter [Phycisphaera sp.]|nr:HlyC/CorC family transporter [Phycisphaera sp.]